MRRQCRGVCKQLHPQAHHTLRTLARASSTARPLPRPPVHTCGTDSSAHSVRASSPQPRAHAARRNAPSGGSSGNSASGRPTDAVSLFKQQQQWRHHQHQCDHHHYHHHHQQQRRSQVSTPEVLDCCCRAWAAMHLLPACRL
eukprot:365081-Chlamydomonas_euryale.AAC.3